MSSKAQLRMAPVGLRDRESALELLADQAAFNLLLIEMVLEVGRSSRRREPAPEILGVWRARDLVGVAAIRPTIVLDHQMPLEGVDLIVPSVDRLKTGLLKSGRPGADELWHRLQGRGRKAVIDRAETSYRRALAGNLPEGFETVARCHSVRTAEPSDLEELVHAARASLREEQRPDPFEGDPTGFRRWVLGRVPRARVVDIEDKPRFVAYADVRRPAGWLVQGVYTWPDARRKGLARSGMMSLVQEAHEAGADHVQLAVVDGNRPAVALYEGLGFEAFDELRTVLFS